MLSLALVAILSAPPRVAVLSASGDRAELRAQPLGSPVLTEPLATFQVMEGSDVYGAVLPARPVVVANATLRRARDLSFAASLLRLERGRPARTLVDRVVHASRPVVLEDGRVFVMRGVAGQLPAAPGDARVDALSIDEVDVETGATRAVYETQGLLTHLVGAVGRELLVLEVKSTGQRLLAIHADTLAVRALLPSSSGAAPTLARDFAVDARRGRVFFTQADLAARRWVVTGLDVKSGEHTHLATSPEVTLLPAVLADGRVLVSRGPGAGLGELPRWTPGALQAPVLVSAESLPVAFAAQGPGFERPRLELAAVRVVVHETPSEFPQVFATRANSERVAFAVPPQARIELAGVLP